MSLASPVYEYTYLHDGTGLCTSFTSLPILSINLINDLSFNCYMCYQMIHKLF